MIKENKKWLKQWEMATHNLTNEFIDKYFKGSANDVFWVGDDIGGVFSINDYFFDLDRMREAIKYNASSKRLFEYQDKELDLAMKDKKMDINFKTYLKIGTFNFKEYGKRKI